jgi:hypothetical protein
MEALDIPLVPFGKYKGKPVTTMMADQNYINWAKNNHIFKEGTPIYNYVFNVVNITPNQDTPTPEHNEMQNMFLQKPIRERLLNHLFNPHEKLQRARKRLQALGIPIPESLQTDKLEENVTFETKHNWDVRIESEGIYSFMTMNNWQTYLEHYGTKEDHERLSSHIKSRIKDHNKLCDYYKEECNKRNRDRLKEKDSTIEPEQDDQWKREIEECERKYEAYTNEFLNIERSRNVELSIYFCSDNKPTISRDYSVICEKRRVVCEIKPSVGDDYPCILRKMNSQIQKEKQDLQQLASRLLYNVPILEPCLIIKEFCAKGATLEQVREIFKQHNITIVMLSDIVDKQDAQEEQPHPQSQQPQETLEERVKRLEEENKSLREQLALQVIS